MGLLGIDDKIEKVVDEELLASTAVKLLTEYLDKIIAGYKVTIILEKKTDA